MSFPTTAFHFALVFGLLAAVLSLARESYQSHWFENSSSYSYSSRSSSSGDGIGNGLYAGLATFATFLLVGTVIFVCDWSYLYFSHPARFEGGMWGMYMMDLLIMFFGALIVDLCAGSVSLALVVPIFAIVGLFIQVAYVEHTNLPNDNAAKRIAHLANVTEEKLGDIPDTDANHMVIVSSEVATNKAKQALASGEASQLQANTYFKLGPATLEYIDAEMWFVFQLEFTSANNKHRQHDIVPGYLMVNAEDPGRDVVQHLGVDGEHDYRMSVSLGGGQYDDVVRFAYTHGYSHYQIKDPMLEVDDSGKPYISLTLNLPAAKWDFSRPVKFLLIDPKTEAIHEFPLNKVPNWVDRVYSSDDAVNMMNWWGKWDKAKFLSNSHAGRFKVSGEPELVYTKAGYASWRMLMSSYNNDTSVNYIVLFDTRTNNVQVYRPGDKPVGTEDAVLGVFNGTSNGNVVASKFTADGLTLHMIYGQLTWVVNYVSTNGNTTFSGVGLLNAYKQQNADVVFGATKQEALQNYQAQLASTDDNSGPNENGKNQTINGVIAKLKEDVESGQSIVYVVLKGDNAHLYRIKETSTTPDLLFAKVGDPVIITFRNENDANVIRNVGAFTDTKVGLTTH